MFVFDKRGKPEYRRKNSQSRPENQQNQLTYDALSRNQTWDTLVVGERSHHCANTATQFTEGHSSLPLKATMDTIP